MVQRLGLRNGVPDAADAKVWWSYVLCFKGMVKRVRGVVGLETAVIHYWGRSTRGIRVYSTPAARRRREGGEGGRERRAEEMGMSRHE